MPSPLEFVRHLFGQTTVDTIVKAPVGAWIPQQNVPQQIQVTIGAGGRPMMDAAQAQVHNTTLFHGMASWGPLTALAIVALAIVWSRFLRN